MISLSTPETYWELGFPKLETVSTLRTIAHLFGSGKDRCGIYLLAFPSQKVYIGQAGDVVRRFAEHRKNYDEIIGFSFIPTKRTQLDTVERELIHKAELAGLVILNTVYVSNVIGDTDLDMVLSPEQQEAWLSSPAKFNKNDTAAQIDLPATQIARFADKYRRLKNHRLFVPSSELLRTYLCQCVPSPARTEYSFWVVSCLPGTNQGTWPRLFCLSAGVMELLVLGYDKADPSRMWGFVTVASDVLSETFSTDRSLTKAFPTIEIVRRDYKDAGQHQVTLCTSDERSMRAILEHNAIRQAAGTLALRVMRKRATIYAKFHCKQLATSAMLSNG